MPSRQASPHELGARGEKAAARYLRRLGYTILAGGFRLRCGEIDLIAVDHHGASWLSKWLGRGAGRRTVVFVEVKTRSSTARGNPAQAVDEPKQKRLSDAARAYIKANHLNDYPTRFDVVAIVWPVGDRRPASIRHYENAFRAPEPEGWRHRSGPVYG